MICFRKLAGISLGNVLRRLDLVLVVISDGLESCDLSDSKIQHKVWMLEHLIHGNMTQYLKQLIQERIS